MTGFAFAVYWFGLALVLFWATLPLAAEPAAASALGPISRTSMAIERPASF
jgi:hypothetical protein